MVKFCARALAADGCACHNTTVGGITVNWRVKLGLIGALIVLVGIPLFLVFGLFIPDDWWIVLFHPPVP